ncbi:MAG TPA: protein kinase [Ktedonobacteraceae bacterium]|nr:protein kinase [Ktedonobacteraceae bacterium]
MAIDELQGGRYRYTRLLGSGGMGEVYLMQDTRVSRQVAIKVLRVESGPYPDSDKATDAVRLFQREAKAIAALDHPNILPLYDFGEEIRGDLKITYMVMPYCTDGSLESWLRQRTGQLLSWQQTAYLVEQAAEALQYAHDHEMIHLDVKPSNFLLRNNKKDAQRPTLLLADFGIARNFTTVSSSSRTIRGTPTSMAPEQWSGNPVFASDQYALAVMAYELLAGRPPFTGSMEQLMYKHFSIQSPPASQFNPRLPAALASVLSRALAKKPEERYPSVADFANAYMEAVQQSSTSSDQTGSGDIASYATLSVSQSEADTGIDRAFILPDGSQITVPIPAGTRDGQVIRLPDLNETSEQTGKIFVNIAIKRPAEPHTPEAAAVQADRSSDTPHPVQPVRLMAEDDIPTLVSSRSVEQAARLPLRPPERRPIQRLGIISLIVVLVVLSAGTFYVYTNRQSRNTGSNAPQNHVTTPTPTPTATPTPLPGLYIAGNYNGSMTDATNGQGFLVTIAVTQSKGYAPLSGTFTFRTPSQGSYPLHGTIDPQGKFSFTIQPEGQTPLYFYGNIQRDVYLHGNYCNGTGPCQTPVGFFTVGPRY